MLIIGIVFSIFGVIFIILFTVSTIAEGMDFHPNWIEVYICKCGTHYIPPWGKLFYLDNVCKNCGETKYKYVKKIGRKISKNWEYKI